MPTTAPHAEDMLAAIPLRAPDKLFATMDDGTNPLTWRQAIDTRNRVANGLAALRVPHASAAIYAKNSVEWLLCAQVCAGVALRWSPVNWHLAPEEVHHVLGDCGATVVFFDGAFVQTVERIRPRLPNVRHWVCIDGEDACPPWALKLSALAACPDARYPDRIGKGGVVMYTGGTSGKPKGAVREGGGLGPDTFVRLGLHLAMPHHVQVTAAPLYHAMPCAWSTTIATAMGGTVVVMQKFEARRWLAAVQRYKVNAAFMPPILLKRLLAFPASETKKFDTSSLRSVVVAGAPCPPNVKLETLDRFGDMLYELYGASELSVVTVIGPQEMRGKPTSVGKEAPEIEIMLLDDQKQPITKPNTPGEVYAKGKNISHYHNSPEKTKEAKMGKSGEWMTVGDVAYFDEDGYFYISDRKIDMIISGGANIYPAEIEKCLHENPSIEDCAVFGVPDEEYGERVHAAIRCHPGQLLTADQVREHCNGRIANFKIPKAQDISFHTEDFPRTDAGKLLKRRLRDRFWTTQKAKL